MVMLYQGAGKSTQVPQYLLEAGYTKIAVTQPRRIACYSLARRVRYNLHFHLDFRILTYKNIYLTSYETMSEHGAEIAYKVRFEGTRTEKTKVLFLTEGLLLRQFAAEPLLPQYDLIVLDEVHERHTTGDLLLGLLKTVLEVRKDLKGLELHHVTPWGVCMSPPTFF
jgi:ATP-dependent RNA helicase DHX34